jgi:hypothetical protein
LLPTAALVAAIVYSTSLPRDDRPLLTAPTSWTHTANVQPQLPGGWFILSDRPDTVYWVAARYEGDGAGKLVSTTFAAPPWISVTVNGDLTRPGNDVYFQFEEDGTRLPVRARTEEVFWRRVTLAVPSARVGKNVRLIVEAGPRDDANQFGVSNPRAFGSGTVLTTQLKTLAFLPAFVLATILFLAPGVLPAAFLVHRGVVGPALFLPLAVVVSSLAGYLTFWAYFFSSAPGKYFGVAVLTGSVTALPVLLASARSGQALRSLLASRDVWVPLVLTLLVGLFYVALLYSVDLEVGVAGQPRLRFFEFTLANDNEIPTVFAEHLYKGENPRDVSVGWHSSDRPPLQSGLILLQLPLGYLLGEARVYSIVVGIALQTAWVPAVWAFWSASGIGRRQAGMALLFVVLSGFALINTTFAWPKMLAAALTLFAIMVALFDREVAGGPLSFGRALLLGLSAALAALGHGGVAFTLLPLAVALLLPRWYPGLSRLVAAGVVFAAMVVPWSLYQKYFDPPGTKLLKLHLAGENKEGDTETWQDGRPLWQNLQAAYGRVSAQQVLQNKLANLRVLFTAAPDQYSWPPREAPPTLPADATGFRRCDFLALFWSLGVLNVGWLVAAFRLARRNDNSVPSSGGAMLLLCLTSVFAWVVILFGPGGTVIHQGPYATFLLLFACLAAWLVTLPGRWLAILLLAQGSLFAWGWLLSSPANSFGPPNVFMIPAALLLFGTLVRFALRAAPGDKQAGPAAC